MPAPPRRPRVAQSPTVEEGERPAAPQVVVHQHVDLHLPPPAFTLHGIYAILTLVSCGLWAPVWLIHYLCWSAGRSR